MFSKKIVSIICVVFSLVFILQGCSSLEKVEKLANDIDILSLRVESYYKELITKKPGNEKIKLSFARFYYKRKDFKKVQDLLKDTKSDEAKILLAKTSAHLQDYNTALEIFESMKRIDDGESLYLYGLTLEKKNLFPQAKKIYKKVKNNPYAQLAQQRLKALGLRFGQKLPGYLQKIIKNAPGLKDFPNASSVILLCDEELEITRDNKSVATIHMIVKVLNDKGREEWGEVEIGYDSTYEKVELEFARTISPTQEIIYAGKENIRDVSKYLNFPLYSNAKAYIISMPEVLKESIIEYKVKIYKNKLINKDDFSFIYRLKEAHPIVDCRFTLRVPRRKKIFLSTLNQAYLPPDITFKPRKEIKGRFIEYTFQFKGIEQFIPESKMVPASFVNPAFVVSSFTDWKEFYQWWRALYKDKIAFTKELRTLLASLVDKSDTPYEKARKIYEFCADKIRYVAVEYGEAGFEPHYASQVLLNKYGDCKDQAILLVALLKGAGLKAYPVLIPTKEAYNLDTNTAASYFNHAITCVKIKDKLIFMDPTSSVTSFQDLPPSDQKRKVLVFFDNRYEILETPLIDKNAYQITMNIDIDNQEKACFRRSVTSEGFYASSQRYYLQYTPPQLLEDDLREKMKTFASLSELVDFKTENIDDLNKKPLLEYNFIAHNLLSKVQDLRILPLLGEELVDTSWINRDRRSYPLYLGSPNKVEIDVDIKIPSEFILQYLPQNLSIKSAWLDFELTYTKEKRNILFREVLMIKQEIVREDEYAEFKRIIEEILYNLKQQIILKKIK